MSRIVTYHNFHLVRPSIWPFATSISVFSMLLNLCLYSHRVEWAGLFLIFSIIFVLIYAGFWWSDVVSEATFEGYHTQEVQYGLRNGFYLFIASEVMFFFSFFWAFIHSSLSPSVWIGSYWPPVGIQVLDPFGLPLLNTALLLWSGCTVTYCHHAVRESFYRDVHLGFILTILAAFLFTLFQLVEYIEAKFDISDSVYGSCFFMLTGFHGLHVIIGTIFLTVCYIRFIFQHYGSDHHLGLEFAIWYWHFVDVVWILLYILVYCWGNSSVY